MWLGGLDLGHKAGADIIKESSISSRQSRHVIASYPAGGGVQESLEKTPVTMPMNDAYQLRVEEWVCTFAISLLRMRRGWSEERDGLCG